MDTTEMPVVSSLSTSDTEKGSRTSRLPGHSSSTSDEDACFKLWNMYIIQAQEYDKSLLEGWKSDMDGMLLFSALYSAILTAFIIESYKNLQADPTVALLTQISQQLTSLSNGTAANFDAPSFQPSAPSILCNILWFLSLALGLTCSLLATFVQQWTRDFMHKATLRPSPVVQARVLAFTYLGLRRFGMHTFVDTIPILLHISILSFFVGLIGFLLPVNLALTYLVVCVLVVFMLVYIGLTCIPLFYLDAPYRTPVSDLLWRCGNMLHGFMLRQHTLSGDLSLTEAVLEKSLRDPSDRDRLCMEYTMKSLNYDTELLPIFEAIPEAILKPGGGVRLENFTLVASLFQSSNPEHNIVSRIHHFISNSGTSADPTRQTKDMTTALKALRSLAQLVIQYSTTRSIDLRNTPVFWFDRGLLNVLEISETLPKDLRISTLALVRTSRLQSLKRRVDAVADALSSDGPPHGLLQTANDIFDGVSLEDVHWDSKVFKSHFIQLSSILRSSTYTHSCTEEQLQQARRAVSHLLAPGRWKAAMLHILGEFLFMSAKTHTMPFEMDTTYKLIHSSSPLAVFDTALEVEEEEAVASFIPSDLSINPETPDFPETVPPELFVLMLRLFFSTTHEASSNPNTIQCRKIILEYLGDCSREQKSYLVEQDTDCHFEKCIIQGLHDDTDPGHRVIAIVRLYDMGLYRAGNHVSSRLRTFARQIFDFIPTASHRYTEYRWWPFVKAQTDWVLCKDAVFKLDDLANDHGDASSLDSQTTENIHALGQRLMADFSAPNQLSPLPETADPEARVEWISSMQKYIMSMNLRLIARLIDMCTQDNDGVLLGDWNGMQWKLVEYHGHVYEKIQLEYAESLWKLISLAPWQWNQTSQEAAPASKLFYDCLWRLSRSWSWVTDAKSARLIVQSIQRHMNDQNFRGAVWYEQALLDRCIDVIRESDQSMDRSGEGGKS
ncbi:hypothetical protein D9758_006110 [Tetrapyrgos nigripes]|uniref:DUF6535 domain-containing protein n=1 Tax=Tetrapyrgos nigripes TaxID=182062 RepID=A0A8H5D8Y9_9AGAR|nr:hypothetical protein D9758_006110 [Tetrapyrgos nigripes]